MKLLTTNKTTTKGERIGNQKIGGQECKIVHRLPHDPYILVEFLELKDMSQKGLKNGYKLQWYVHENDLCINKQ